mmetsp:Transcript_23251/g.34451  ORF Transcript_23251/g.34451 Transcript_23251/m.34451 type:complete len:105 (-) Transcript_23251:708-1022(-)
MVLPTLRAMLDNPGLASLSIECPIANDPNDGLDFRFTYIYDATLDEDEMLDRGPSLVRIPLMTYIDTLNISNATLLPNSLEPSMSTARDVTLHSCLLNFHMACL